MTDEACASMIAEKILQSVLGLAIPHGHSAVSDVISISIGVCCFKAQSHIEPEQLLYRADQCLYEAKKTGRNKVVTCNQV